jgi:5-methylcytosine-specific restriction enzyme subunit McrC
VRRLARELDSYVSEITLDLTTLQQAWWTIDRRTRSYEPTLTLVGLLVESEGISLDDQPEMLRLPGFLFDMNRFFQSLISRLLKEHLKGYVVQDEHRLKGMFSYDPAHNPRGRRAPIQRPDFAIVQAGMTIEVLDAKYRDLWEKRLPTDMLYQLALYALGRHGTERRSTILYPTMNTGANDQIIVVQEPMFGSPEARVTLRPVKLLELDSLLLAPSDRCGTKKRTEYAHQLVFGKKNDPWPE